MVTDEDKKFFYSRVINSNSDLLRDGNPNNKTVIVCIRDLKPKYNYMFLSVLPSKQHHIIERDIDALDRNNRTISIRKTREQYPKVLTIKIGAKVMLLRNMSVKKDWVNGTIGTITRIGNNAIEIEKLRIKNPALKNTKIIKRHRIPMESKDSHDYFREQIPAELSYAMTIHKAQGQTLEIVYVNLAFAFAHGQAYVALSRVKDPNHLHLIGYDEAAFTIVDANIINALNDLELRHINN